MMISIADLFFGLAAIVMILIVLSSSTSERLVPEYVDKVVECSFDEDSNPLIKGENSKEKLTGDWIEGLDPSTLILRVGVVVRRPDLACYAALNKAFRSHNVSLDTGESDRPVLSLVPMPDAGDDDDAAQ